MVSIKRASRLKKIKMPAPLISEKISRPTQSDTYKWCDFIELRCLLSNESRFSRGQLIEVLEDSAQLYGEVTDADDKLLDVRVPDEDSDLEEDFNTDTSDNETVEVPIRSSVRNESRAANWFSSLQFRQSLFGDAYPFEVTTDRQEIFVRNELDEAQRLYIQLLLSSSLRLITKTRWPDLTEPFELLSSKIFESLMPRGWSVFRFGAKGSTRYKGKLYDKLQALAVDIRAVLTAPEHYFNASNTGDGGLDLVAWHPLGDERIGIPVALAQCGCVADEWAMKTLEASPARLGANLRAPVAWMTYYFMPHDLVYNAGGKNDWQRGNDLTGSIIIDRYRLIKLATDYDLLEPKNLTTTVVDEVLALTQ